MSFSAPNYSFDIFGPILLNINGSGILVTPTGSSNIPTFDVPDGQLHFFNSSTAGPALIHVDGIGNAQFRDTSGAGSATILAGDPGDNDDFSGGFVQFFDNSTADHATIAADLGSNIEFHDASRAGYATITIGNQTLPEGAGDNGFMFFDDTSTADHANITVNRGGELDFSPIFPGGCCTGGTSTAGNATIASNGIIGFYQGSSGGNATITTNAGGTTSFFGTSTGGQARLITNAGGIVDISGLGTFPDTGAPPANVPGMTAGSIEGAGTYFLGSKQLTVGSNNLDTQVSGSIEDGGPDATVAHGRVVQLGFAGGGGSLVKVGTGTLTLSGNNTYSGGTTINEGAIAVQADSELGAPTGPLTFGGGTLRFDSSFDLAPSRAIVLNAANGVFAGGGAFDTNGFTTTVGQGIQGPGGLTKAGAGTLTLTGANGYTGGTTISLGTLQLGNGGAVGSIVGNVVNNGTLAFNRGDTVTFPGVISGTGGVAQIGSGTTILTGNNTYTGLTTISSGTLELGNGGASGSIIGIEVADNGTLTFDHSTVVPFPGVISGAGGLAQIGGGTTILSADNTYTGGTSVSAGTLAVGDAGHPGAALSGGGPVSIAAGAALAGYGSVTGDVVNAGTIAVANALPLFSSGPVGTFTINGGLQNAGLLQLTAAGAPGNVLSVKGNYADAPADATLAIATVLNAGGALSNQFTDRLLVFGSAAGTTTVRISPRGSGAVTSTGIPDPSDGISVIQVAGPSSAGAFTLPGGYITGGTAYQYHLYAYGPGSPNGSAYAPQSLVGNPAGHWDYRLQNAYVDPPGPVPPEPEPPTPPGPTPPGPTPPPPPVPPDVRLELAPQAPAYITAPTALFSAGFQDLDSLHRRLGEIRDDQLEPAARQGEVFVRAFGSSLDYTSNRSFTEYGFDASSDYAALQFGANGFALNNESGTLRLGLAGTLGRLWYQPSAVDGTSEGLFNTQTLAGTATWQSTAGWYVDAIIAGGLFDGQVTTPQRGETTGFNGTSLAGSLEAGYPFALGGGFAVEPQAQIVYQHLNFDRRTDVDGIAVDLGSPSQGVFRAGVRLTKQFVGPDGVLLTPYLKANLLQGLGGGDSVHLSGQSFATGQFGTALQVGAGVTGALTRFLSVYGDVAWQGDVGNGGFRGWAYNGGLRYTFGFAPAPPPPIPVTPVAAPVAATRTYLVFFDWDRADLTARARQIIAEAAANAGRVQVTRVMVDGYTDSSGSPQYNQGLSVRRAEAVAAELVRDGVARGAIVVRGFGEAHPLVPTGPGVREPQNRRVEIVLR